MSILSLDLISDNKNLNKEENPSYIHNCKQVTTCGSSSNYDHSHFLMFLAFVTLYYISEHICLHFAPIHGLSDEAQTAHRS